MNYIYKFLFIAVAGLFVSCRFRTDDKNGLINAYLLSNGKIVCNSKAIKAYIISYENQQGRVPEQIALVEGTCMTLEYLPVLKILVFMSLQDGILMIKKYLSAIGFLQR